MSTSTYEAGTHSPTILPTYLLTPSITPHREVAYFFLSGWYLLNNHPTYLRVLTSSRPNETVSTSTYDAGTHSLTILHTYSLHHVAMRQQLPLLTRLLITHSPVCLLTYLLTSTEAPTRYRLLLLMRLVLTHLPSYLLPNLLTQSRPT